MNGNDVEEDLRLMRELRDRLRTPLAKEELDACIQHVYCCVSSYDYIYLKSKAILRKRVVFIS